MSKFRGAKPNKAPFSKNSRPISNPVSDSDLKPVFSFQHMNSNSGWSIDCCQAEDRAQLSAKLFRLSQLTWAQIRQSSRHALGSEILTLSTINASIPAVITDDVKLLAFRYNGKKAMVGYKDGHVFHVIWLDWNYTLYRHD
jgi:hypothetical protein